MSVQAHYSGHPQTEFWLSECPLLHTTCHLSGSQHCPANSKSAVEGSPSIGLPRHPLPEKFRTHPRWSSDHCERRDQYCKLAIPSPSTASLCSGHNRSPSSLV